MFDDMEVRGIQELLALHIDMILTILNEKNSKGGSIHRD